MARRTFGPFAARELLIGALALSIGLALGSLWTSNFRPSGIYEQTDAAIREQGKYRLVAPLLACATYENTNLNSGSPLKTQIQNLIDSEKRSGNVQDVSVYFRGYDGFTLGINENQAHVPASLLKVPLMIAYYKVAETQPHLLDKTLTYDGSFDQNKDETFKSPYDIKPGVYKVSELLKAMITNSDNNATVLLYNGMDPGILANVYTDLGLTVPDDDTPTVNVISAKQYSYFFRILYNATYLSPEYSEKALELLAGNTFPNGIEASVPKGVQVADKFGERTVVDAKGNVVERELHDCGFVYATERPYLLCVMTKGKDFEKLTNVIQSIGKLVYTEAVK